jgi:hypothetical protein
LDVLGFSLISARAPIKGIYPLELGLRPGGILHGEWESTSLDRSVEFLNSDFVGLDGTGFDFGLFDDSLDSDE